MNIIKNTIKIGIEKPFTFLHMTDTHLTCTDNADTPERVAFAKQRRDAYFSTADEDIIFAEKYIEQSGHPLFHTGDLVDFITPENLAVAKKFCEKTGALFIAGNHEIHTCPNNLFCEEDFTKDLNNRVNILANTNTFFPNDIDFFCKEINGVYLVGINNYDYQISENSFNNLKELAKNGKPMIIFMHIPLYEKGLFEKMGGALLAIPDEMMSKQRVFIRFEQEANEVTKQTAEFIKKCPQIKLVVCGHLHFDYESPEDAEIKQLVTGMNTLREITVE